MAIATGQGFCLRYIVGENEISGYAGRFPFAGVLLGSLFESLGQGLIHAARFEQDVEVLEQELFGFCISWGNSSQRLESCNLALRIINRTDWLDLLGGLAIKETVRWFRGVRMIEWVRLDAIHAGLGVFYKVYVIPGHNSADRGNMADIAGDPGQMLVQGLVLVLYVGMAGFAAQALRRGFLGPSARIVHVGKLVLFRLVAINADHAPGHMDIPLRRKIYAPLPPGTAGRHFVATQAGLA